MRWGATSAVQRQKSLTRRRNVDGDGTVSVLLVGVSHRSAPVAVLEQIAVSEADRPKMVQQLLESEAITEAMIVSTCNRVEYYVVTEGFHAGLADTVRTMSEFSGVESADLTPHLYVRYAEGAAEHMLTVASGLDSMVVGEQQILGQIRSAYQSADEHGSAGRTLHELAQRALHTGKRVHTETAIDSAGGSMVSVAIDHAVAQLAPEKTDEAAPLAGFRALILGAGAMSSLAAAYLGRAGISHITVANRTVANAENLAAHAVEAGVPAVGTALERIDELMADADLVIAATGAMLPVVHIRDIEMAQARRENPQLTLVDLSLPRDVADGVRELDNVTLVDITSIQQSGGAEVGDRVEDQARGIVDYELESFLAEQRAQQVAPTVKALRERAGEVVAAELLRLETKTPGMSEKDRAAVAQTVRRVVDKLLHQPTVQVKKLATSQGASSYAEALQRLFDLPLTTPSVIYRDTEVPTGVLGERADALLVDTNAILGKSADTKNSISQNTSNYKKEQQ